MADGRNAAALGPVVMGTGIVSIALALDGRETASRVLLVVTAAEWVVLCVLVGRMLLVDLGRAKQQASSPAALAVVAGTAVLGTRLAMLGWSAAAIACLAIGLILWLVLLVPVLRHWITPTIGVSLILAVSTESLAVLCASLAVPEHAPWLLAVALVPFLLGLGFYVFVIWSFDIRQLVTGRGDHWITGGALAISTLAVARITLSGRDLHELVTLVGTLKVMSLALWVATIIWLPALLVAELLAPRLHYDMQRWSTVFPIGMYAACSFMVGAAANVPAIGDFGRIWVWVGVAVWLVVFAAMLSRGRQLAKETEQPG